MISAYISAKVTKAGTAEMSPCEFTSFVSIIQAIIPIIPDTKNQIPVERFINCPAGVGIGY
jgi:hypothetical protein